MSNYQDAIYSFANRRITKFPPLPSKTMEAQFNVKPGEPVEGKKNVWTDGEYEFHHIRLNAERAKYKCRFPLDPYFDKMGFTGWDWGKLCSRWAGFDFDSIVGHAAGVGVTDEELERTKDQAIAIPWVEVRRSTHGNGLHFYVYFDEIPTAHHDEHAALARVVLTMMASATGFNFAKRIDVCGGNMWRHAASETENGYELLKAADRALTVADFPANWKDHVEVVTRRRAKVQIRGIDDADLATLNKVGVPLDEDHQRIIAELTKSGFSTIWQPDHHLLQTHTRALAKLLAEEKVKGVFTTVSEGRDPGTPNCFLIPRPNGTWRAVRFSRGAKEAASWIHGEWTYCDFNRKPDLAVAARSSGGLKDPKGGFFFATAGQLVDAGKVLGADIDLPASMHKREGRLKTSKEGLVASIVRTDEDEQLDGWIPDGKQWVKVFDLVPERSDEDDDGCEDVRYVETTARVGAGYALKGKHGEWSFLPAEAIKNALAKRGYKDASAKVAMGDAVDNRMTLVSLPFQDEYPAPYQWNIDAAKFLYPIADEDGEHLHWDLIHSHLGASLDAAVLGNEWCQRENVTTGSHWLRLWIANMVRNCSEHTPYLFFFGDTNAGKSTFVESLKLIMTGIRDIKQALTCTTGFNQQLAGTILGYVEEIDLSKHSQAANRIKEWVTAKTIAIRAMNRDVYELPSVFHGCQMGNDPSYCPIFHNNARIVPIRVRKPDTDIPWETKLKPKLIEEASYFLRTIQEMHLPSGDGRMAVSVLKTSDEEALAIQHDPLPMFVKRCCRREDDPTKPICKKDVHEIFMAWCKLHNSRTIKSIGAFGRALAKQCRDRDINLVSDGKAYSKIFKEKDKTTPQRTDAHKGLQLTQEALSLIPTIASR